MALDPKSLASLICRIVVNIALNESTSGAADLGGTRLAAVQLPATFEGTALTFTAAPDGVTYVPVYAMDGAAVYSVTVGTSRIVPVDARVFAGLQYLKCVSNAAGGENAATTVTLITRPA